MNSMIPLVLLLFGPPALFLVLAIHYGEKGDKTKASIFYILMGVYLFIGLGMCGDMLV